jgi:coenzyme F420-reducing hydrogenase alpha subunit
MPSTKTPSRGPREKARKKRTANQLRKVDYHQARIEELETALRAIQELLDEELHFDMRIGIEHIIQQVMKSQ